MKSKLERLIEDRRDELDVENPDLERSWIFIFSKLYHKRKTHRWQFSVAASILILISIGLGVMINDKSNIDQYQFTSQLSDFAVEASEQNQILEKLIAGKIIQIENSPLRRSEIRILRAELIELDELSNFYLTDLYEMGGDSKVVNGILRCTQLKLRIIENTLLEIKRNENHEIK